MPLTLLGAILLVTGFAAAVLLERRRTDSPPADWYPDPTTTEPRRRRWDGQAWHPTVADGSTAAARGRRFRGRFWGAWVWFFVAALVVLGVGSALYTSSENVTVMGWTSFLAMSLVCAGFYRFVARQVALDEVVGPLSVLAGTVAGAGATLLIALNLNDLVIENLGGVQTATRTVGFTEELAKLVVPLALFLVGRYRNPRAGIAMGIAAGFGFAIAETTLYAYETAAASGPNFCGTVTPEATPMLVIQAQVARIWTVSPLHWLWTGIAVAVAWRLWRVYGGRGTPAAVGVILAVMVVHSVNDTSSTLGCGNPGVSFLLQVFRWGLFVATYLVFKAMVRKSTPPELIGVVSKGWTPQHLGEVPVAADDAPATVTQASEPPAPEASGR